VFVQDQVALAPTVDLIAGVKLESNVYTGTEPLPNVRLAWRALPDHFVWAAASRAVRAPARVERDFYTPGAAPFLVAGGPDFVSEVANVYEIGYRAQPLPRLSFSITAFYEDWQRLRSLEPQPGGARFENLIDGSSTGLEAWASYRATDAWRLTAGVALLDERLRRTDASRDPQGPSALGNDPDWWWSVRSLLDLAPQVQLDVGVRRVGALPAPPVPAYTAVDARLAWNPTSRLELSATVQNALGTGHTEWGVPANRVELGRAVFFRVAWRTP
jgi:iron complex outermembrane receptor protein